MSEISSQSPTASTESLYFGLLREFTLAHLKVKDQSAVFGLLWSLLNPLIMLSVMYFFFRYRVGRGIDNYPIYLLIGIVHYTHFSNATGAAMSVLESRRELAQSTVFPKEILVLSMVLSRSIDLLVSVALYGLLAVFTGVAITSSLLLLPLALIAQILLVTWVSLLLASAYGFVRDTRHIWSVVLRLLLFTTPIFYAPEFLGEGLVRKIGVDLNPLAQIITLGRSAVLGTEAVGFQNLASLLLLNLLLLVFALAAFRRYESALIEAL